MHGKVFWIPYFLLFRAFVVCDFGGLGLPAAGCGGACLKGAQIMVIKLTPLPEKGAKVVNVRCVAFHCLIDVMITHLTEQ